MEPKIIGYEKGYLNSNFELSLERITKEATYKDHSLIVLIPALNQISTKAASSWWNLIFPPNQKVVKLFAQGMEVGEAYSQTIEQILKHPELQSFKYLLTIEADNVVPPDGVIKLFTRMEEHPELSCIGGLYWTKGHGGMPQIWGDVKDPVLNFRPMPPIPNQLVECCGTGMGFNLWRIDTFRDERLRKPWFKTMSNSKDGVFSQDLYFWTDARKYGYRCAIDCSVLVGHVDGDGFVW